MKYYVRKDGPVLLVPETQLDMDVLKTFMDLSKEERAQHMEWILGDPVNPWGGKEVEDTDDIPEGFVQK